MKNLKCNTEPVKEVCVVEEVLWVEFLNKEILVWTVFVNKKKLSIVGSETIALSIARNFGARPI